MVCYLETNFQLMTNLCPPTSPANGDSKTSATPASEQLPSANEFAQCVENINVLNLRLKNSEERCQLLKNDLRQAKQVS